VSAPPDRRHRVRLTCENAERPPYPDASFDVAYGSSILHCVPLKSHFAVSPGEMAFSRSHARPVPERLGYADVRVDPFDVPHPSTSSSMPRSVARPGELPETVALTREVAGSLRVRARRPSG
jgi:hypothetical protein